MKNHQRKVGLFSWFLLFVFLYLKMAKPILSQEVEQQHEFDYNKWSKKGPGRWGEVKKEWETCKLGKLQSPINILTKTVNVIPKFGALRLNYKPANATFTNRGHDIAVEWVDNAGSIQIDGIAYFLKQCHWHSPSEHAINGKRFDLELHMVHTSQPVNGRSKIAVLALLYKLGQPDRFLSKLTEDIMHIADSKRSKPQGVIDPIHIRMAGFTYFRYVGSLTVPPCIEGVIWTINTKILTVSKRQVSLLKEAVHDFAEINYRPLQPLNGRNINYFGSWVPLAKLQY